MQTSDPHFLARSLGAAPGTISALSNYALALVAVAIAVIACGFSEVLVSHGRRALRWLGW